MKKILLIVFISAVISLFVYKITYSNKKTIMVLGDSLCTSVISNKKLKISNTSYCKNGLSINSLKNMLVNNYKIDSNTILSSINKSNYLVITIGNDEFSNYKRITNSIMNNYLTEYKDLLKTIIKNTKARLFIVGIRNNNSKNILELNKKLAKISQNNDAVFINPNTQSIIDIIKLYI